MMGIVRIKWWGEKTNNQLDEADLKMNAKGVAYRMMSSRACSFHIQEIAFGNIELACVMKYKAPPSTHARTQTRTAGRAY